MCLFVARLMCLCALGSLRSPSLASLAWLASLAAGASRPQHKHVMGFHVMFSFNNCNSIYEKAVVGRNSKPQGRVRSAQGRSRDAQGPPRDHPGSPRDPRALRRLLSESETAISRHLQDENTFWVLRSKVIGALYNLYPIGVVKSYHTVATTKQILNTYPQAGKTDGSLPLS